MILAGSIGTRSIRRRRENAGRRGRLACVCGAGAARCFRPAPPRIRAADARPAHSGDQRYPPVPARDDRFDDRGPAVKRGRFPERSERAGRKRADGAAAGGDGNLAIAETP